jgi:hypothetical protein
MSVHTCNFCGHGVAEFQGTKFYNRGKVQHVYKCTYCSSVYERDVPPGWDIEHPKAQFGMLPTKDWFKRKGLIL